MDCIKLKADFSNLHKVEQKLKEKKVWLCDVFDTVLSRRKFDVNLDYYTIFYEIAKKLPEEFTHGADDYAKLRIGAGHAARENNPYHSLVDIARHLPTSYAAIPFFEYVVDRELLVQSKFGTWFIDFAQEYSERLRYFLSDVYYDSKTVAEFLYNAYGKTTLDGWNLCVSASDKVAKSDGTMYDLICSTIKHYGLSGKDCIMVSDQMYDLNMAANYQIEGILIDPELQLKHF